MSPSGRDTSGSRPRLVVASPDWADGGVEQVTTRLVAELRSHAAITLLVGGRRAGGPLLPDDVEVIELGSKRTAAALPAIMSTLRHNPPHAVLSVKDHLSVAIAPIARTSGVPYVVAAVHGAFRGKGANRRGLTGLALPVLMSTGLRFATSLIAVSDSIAQDLKALHLPAERIHVVPNPVIDHRLLEAPHRAVDGCLLPPGTGPLVVCAARLVADKDVETLVRAVALVPGLRLLVLGDGPERPRLDALAQRLSIADRCSLPGFVPDAPAYLARADVVALTSRREGMPTTLVEALALNRPVVATDCPTGPRELLDSGRFGRLCAVGDVDSIAVALGQAAADERPGVERPDLSRFLVSTSAERYRRLLGLQKPLVTP